MLAFRRRRARVGSVPFAAIPMVLFSFLWSVTIFPGPAAASAGDVRVDVKMTPRKIEQGDAVLVQVSSPSLLKAVRGELRGKGLIFAREGDRSVFQGLLGIDLDQTPGKETLKLTVTDDKGAVFLRDVGFRVLEKHFPVQRLTLPSGMVSLSPENLARVERERATVLALFDGPVRERQWKKGFILPVEGALLSPFGVRRVINREPRSPHTGIDLKAAWGEPVRASNDGIVVYTGDQFFAGKCVFLDHGMGIVSMYFHLSEINVRAGENVERGRIIGRAGESGRATGPHLHWGVRIQGSRVDPISLVELYKPSLIYP